MRGIRTAALIGALLTMQSSNAQGRPAAFEQGMQALKAGNYAEAYCLWRPLADQGHAEAQYHVGWLYANGNGLAVDIERALAFWGAAAKQGHADAQFAVALAYTTGEGMDKDLVRATDWYLEAARQGHEDAREILLRLNGEGAIDVFAHHPEVIHEDWFGWQARVKGRRINVRGGPGIGHPIVDHLDQDTRVRVVGRDGDWYRVILPSGASAGAHRQAWIYRNLLKRLDR